MITTFGFAIVNVVVILLQKHLVAISILYCVRKHQLYHTLKDEYLVLKISFEGLGEKVFSSEIEFYESFINLISDELLF